MIRTLVILTTLAAAAGSAWAQVPDRIGFQGKLTNASGTPINATVSITFTLYAGPSGGPALWTETQSVPVVNGIYTVYLGSIVPLDASHFPATRYIGVMVAPDAEMTPRYLIAAHGYTLRAQKADALEGLTATVSQLNTLVGGGNADSLHKHDWAAITGKPAVAGLIGNQVFTGEQTIQTSGPAATGLVVQASNAQSANLQEWRDNAGAAVAAMAPSGVLSASGFSGSGSGLTGVTAAGLQNGIYGGSYSFSNPANSFTGSGAGLTGLSASNLSGTLGTGALSGSYTGVTGLGTLDSLTVAGDVTLQGGAILRSPALGTLLTHASFQNFTSSTTNATTVGTFTFDGGIELNVSVGLGGGNATWMDRPIPLGSVPITGYDRPGAFLSLRFMPLTAPIANTTTWLMAGGHGAPSGILTEGFGFKVVDGALIGVAVKNNVASETSLGVTPAQYAPTLLLAVRRTSSIEFYVDGVLRGSVNSNLPSQSISAWLMRIQSAVSPSAAVLIRIDALTVGIPMF
jgi:hypothetical protein